MSVVIDFVYGLSLYNFAVDWDRRETNHRY